MKLYRFWYVGSEIQVKRARDVLVIRLQRNLRVSKWISTPFQDTSQGLTVLFQYSVAPVQFDWVTQVIIHTSCRAQHARKSQETKNKKHQKIANAKTSRIPPGGCTWKNTKQEANANANLQDPA